MKSTFKIVRRCDHGEISYPFGEGSEDGYEDAASALRDAGRADPSSVRLGWRARLLRAARWLLARPDNPDNESHDQDCSECAGTGYFMPGQRDCPRCFGCGTEPHDQDGPAR